MVSNGQTVSSKFLSDVSEIKVVNYPTHYEGISLISLKLK